MKTATRRAATLAGLLIAGLPPVLAAPLNPSETLRTLVLSSQWSTVFYAAVFFMILLGITVRPLKDKLGKPGTAVAVGLALLMSTSLAVAGHLQLVALAPIAGVGLFTLLGVLVGAVFRRFYEVSWTTTAAVSFVAGYGTMRLADPSLLSTAEELFLIPGLLYALAIVWLVYSFSTQVFQAGNGGSWVGHAVRTLPARPPEARRRLQQVEQAQEALTDVAQQDVADHATVLAELEETEQAIRDNGARQPALRAVALERLEALAETQRKVETEYARYRALTENITGLDAAEYVDLKHDLAQLPEDIQAEAQQALSGLNEKLMTDRVLTNLGQAVEANNIAVRDALLHARAELAAGRVRACLTALEDARNGEREAMRLMAQVQRFTEQLKSTAAKVVAQAGTRAAELVAAK
ncbi:MAG: hypothetical protein ABSE73_00075 [Planctomycetota bacterium]